MTTRTSLRPSRSQGLYRLDFFQVAKVYTGRSSEYFQVPERIIQREGSEFSKSQSLNTGGNLGVFPNTWFYIVGVHIFHMLRHILSYFLYISSNFSHTPSYFPHVCLHISRIFLHKFFFGKMSDLMFAVFWGGGGSPQISD